MRRGAAAPTSGRDTGELMLVFLAVLALYAIIAAFPDTPAARGLRRFLVDGPAAWVSRMRWDIAFLLFAFVTAILLAAHFEPELIFVLIGAGEAAATLLTIVDSALVFEVMLLVWMAAVTGALKTVWRTVCAAVQSIAMLPRHLTFRRGRRAARSRPVRKPTQGKPDDEPGWAFA